MGAHPLRRKASSEQIAVAFLAASAWVVLVVAGRGSGAAWLDHHRLAEGEGTSLALFLAAWTTMIAAMMIPTVVPFVSVFVELMGPRRDRRLLVACFLIVYVAVWTAFGALALWGDYLLHGIVVKVSWLASREALVGGAVVLVAGVAQLTPVTLRCLDRCRSPRSLLLRHWHGGNAIGSVLNVGLRHAADCVGCCWPAMVVAFALGAGSLLWMLVAGTLMLVQKTATWGRAVVRPVGVGLVAWGAIGIVSVIA